MNYTMFDRGDSHDGGLVVWDTLSNMEVHEMARGIDEIIKNALDARAELQKQLVMPEAFGSRLRSKLEQIENDAQHAVSLLGVALATDDEDIRSAATRRWLKVSQDEGYKREELEIDGLPETKPPPPSGKKARTNRRKAA